MKNAVKKGKVRAAAKKKKSVKVKIVDFNDLCTTCNYGSDCVRRSHHGQPVLYCEEFDNYQRFTRKAARKFGDYDPDEKLEMTRLVDSRSMGLCAFCENRETCANPGKAEGIWHCEEYR